MEQDPPNENDQRPAIRRFSFLTQLFLCLQFSSLEFEVIHANVITHAYGIMHRAFHLYNILPHRKDAYTKSEQKLREIFV